MTEEKTLKEIKAGITARGLIWEIVHYPRGQYECTLYDSSESGTEIPYHLEPLANHSAPTEYEAISGALLNLERMAEEKTLKEIKADIVARGWIFENFSTGDGYECELSGPGLDMSNSLCVAPMVSDEGATEEDAIRAAYGIALGSLPSGGER